MYVVLRIFHYLLTSLLGGGKKEKVRERPCNSQLSVEQLPGK